MVQLFIHTNLTKVKRARKDLGKQHLTTMALPLSSLNSEKQERKHLKTHFLHNWHLEALTPMLPWLLGHHLPSSCAQRPMSPNPLGSQQLVHLQLSQPQISLDPDSPISPTSSLPVRQQALSVPNSQGTYICTLPANCHDVSPWPRVAEQSQSTPGPDPQHLMIP